jgi:hypothetical protein
VVRFRALNELGSFAILVVEEGLVAEEDERWRHDFLGADPILATGLYERLDNGRRLVGTLTKLVQVGDLKAAGNLSFGPGKHGLAARVPAAHERFQLALNGFAVSRLGLVKLAPIVLVGLNDPVEDLNAELQVRFAGATVFRFGVVGQDTVVLGQLPAGNRSAGELRLIHGLRHLASRFELTQAMG